MDKLNNASFFNRSTRVLAIANIYTANAKWGLYKDLPNGPREKSPSGQYVTIVELQIPSGVIVDVYASPQFKGLPAQSSEEQPQPQPQPQNNPLKIVNAELTKIVKHPSKGINLILAIQGCSKDGTMVQNPCNGTAPRGSITIRLTCLDPNKRGFGHSFQIRNGY